MGPKLLVLAEKFSHVVVYFRITPLQLIYLGICARPLSEAEQKQAVEHIANQERKHQQRWEVRKRRLQVLFPGFERLEREIFHLKKTPLMGIESEATPAIWEKSSLKPPLHLFRRDRWNALQQWLAGVEAGYWQIRAEQPADNSYARAKHKVWYRKGYEAAWSAAKTRWIWGEEEV
jgi:hypothetical protein